MATEINENCGVYLIVSPSNGRYVGSSKNIKKRVNRYKNHSCSRQSAILASLNKYGFNNHLFKVLYNCSETELLFWERVFGDIYLASADLPNGLNIALPGYDDVPAVRTKEWKDRVSVAQKERFKNPAERDKTSIATKAGFTNEVKEKMSIYWKDRCNTDEFRQERSKRQKQYFSSPAARKKASEATKKYLLENPEQKEKNYLALTKFYSENENARSDVQTKWRKEKPHIAKEHSDRMKLHYINNPEARNIISQRTTKWLTENHPRARKILDTETGEIFKSITQVKQRINKPNQTIRNWLTGISPNPTSYKFI